MQGNLNDRHDRPERRSHGREKAPNFSGHDRENRMTKRNMTARKGRAFENICRI